MKWSLTVTELLDWLGNPVAEGKYDGEITGIADLREAVPGDLTFLSTGKYAKHLDDSAASVVLLSEDQAGSPAGNQVWVRVKDPSLALGTVCEHLERVLIPALQTGIHSTAIVDPTAEIDPSASIGPNCLIGANARIAKGAILDSNVRVEHGATVGEGTHLHHSVVIGWGCVVGKACCLFPGAVIGADGFGFHSDKTGHHRLAQIGKVVIEDSVEVGANACIDRARFSETRIGEGTKIDNLVQIGHNVKVGKHCIICACIGISGSAELGNFVVLAGQVGIAGHLKIGDGVTATGQSGITKDIPPGTVLSGTPARPHREELRKQVLLKKLPELAERLKAIEDKL
ncbi:UDP-3-O-(3-hydroxymyristoyl)glucosamine N-acyltransferase [Puniceicoccales bacterium CK1056]|uniref:UDP-3-O-acylglucosamine N-acyltransferase n=1 Tax=Oceanipulchritudo coccoides TaxID=2706888 RepID=A0A6B2LZA8_9BACT|nr:UDP-3-O-(3-hydroxymyristoyl)glucosamine N-acyltransferase [Oceanipulchritudo coccoides]NDV61379.1 UDP-3-O-(3-hydroxymyristoyl)glucosamine N-acyltransferase [Oceanipulchritudo coccoides]